MINVELSERIRLNDVGSDSVKTMRPGIKTRRVDEHIKTKQKRKKEIDSLAAAFLRESNPG